MVHLHRRRRAHPQLWLLLLRLVLLIELVLLLMGGASASERLMLLLVLRRQRGEPRPLLFPLLHLVLLVHLRSTMPTDLDFSGLQTCSGRGRRPQHTTGAAALPLAVHKRHRCQQASSDKEWRGASRAVKMARTCQVEVRTSSSSKRTRQSSYSASSISWNIFRTCGGTSSKSRRQQSSDGPRAVPSTPPDASRLLSDQARTEKLTRPGLVLSLVKEVNEAFQICYAGLTMHQRFSRPVGTRGMPSRWAR